MSFSYQPEQKQNPEHVVKKVLLDEEHLLWTGRPDRTALASSNPFRSIFGRVIFIIGAVMIYMALSALEENPRSPGVFGLLLGTIFSIFGGSLAFKTFTNWWYAPNTFYAITNKRALIICTRPWFRFEDFTSHQIPFVMSEPYGEDGLGNIIFANEPFGRLRALRAAVGFWGIEKPDEAENYLNCLRENIPIRPNSP